MDLIIKNLEKLQDYHTKEGKHPIERLVLDFDKLSEMEGFTKIFEKSCEKYDEVGDCITCKHRFLDDYEEPCKTCLNSTEIRPNWEPKGPDLKKLYEKYVEVGESYLVPNEDIKKAMESEKTCKNCKYHDLEVYKEPCQTCIESYLALDEINPNWEPAEPTLKEVTERMQSEFDATGKDVKIFMNERVIKR